MNIGQEMALTAEDLQWLNRVSGAQGFADGDPRAGPFGQGEVDDALRYFNAPDRRSTRLSADLYAVRLQFGRGVGRRRTAAMFGISDGTIGTRMLRTGKMKWICNMSERDRRELARLVWLGGLLQLIGSGKDADEAELQTLRAASEWMNVDDQKEDVWLPQDETGEAQTMKVHREIADDDFYTERDPYRDERIAMLAKLEAELDALDDDDDDGDDDDGEDEDDDEEEDGEGGEGEEKETEGAVPDSHETEAGVE